MNEEPPALDLDAEEVYRKAWLQWKVSIGLRRRELEGIMDKVQSSIAPNTNHPRWKWFAASLPGYNEWWENTATRAYEALTHNIQRKK